MDPLPAGSFVFIAKVQADRTTNDTSTIDVQCTLQVEDAGHTPFEFDVATASMSGDHVVLPLATRAEEATDGGRAVVNCNSSGFGVSTGHVTLIAIKVDTLTPTLP